VIGAAARQDVYRAASEGDRFWCAVEARRFAGWIGFGERAQWELAIVVAELISNAVRYAGSATLTFRAAPGRRPGMEIVVADPGAPRAEAPEPRHGLGLGLRTVRALTDALSIERGTDGGTVVTAERYLPP
jgi:anti-sigma regulatory factor (Ser/Thr protein kinase)